ncbi:hypothetical protein E2C01_058590 [Portunus trituberculatus]|uniref:Uncharacterized protein n=1 Tax=Portunus trituberculatus TaxID=210409 RepID=A0A5B7H342_PORTR|nr:hypothetical protein [Portunus trituberculatus]
MEGKKAFILSISNHSFKASQTGHAALTWGQVVVVSAEKEDRACLSNNLSLAESPEHVSEWLIYKRCYKMAVNRAAVRELSVPAVRTGAASVHLDQQVLYAYVTWSFQAM